MSYQRAVRRPPAPDVELYPPFDETLTTGLDDTVRQLKVLRETSHHDEESARWQLKAFEDLQAEVLALRASMAKIVAELNRKAALAAQARFEKAMTERIDKRLDVWRNVIGCMVALIAVLISLYGIFHK